MGLIKMAVYGALGYLAYQMFFADMPASGGGSGGGGQRRGQQSRSRSAGGGAAGGGESNRGAQMTGGGEGRPEATQDKTGASMSHRVGRGVI